MPNNLQKVAKGILDENLSDSLGISLIYSALEEMEKTNKSLKLPGFENWNNRKIFFLSFARVGILNFHFPTNITFRGKLFFFYFSYIVMMRHQVMKKQWENISLTALKNIVWIVLYKISKNFQKYLTVQLTVQWIQV